MKPVKRRTFLGSIAAATAASACAKPSGVLAQDLAGEHFGGCRIERAETYLGAIAVIARDGAGARFQIDVLRRSDDDEGPAGIANTPTLALYLANRGDGSATTDETHGLFLMELGRRLEQQPAASLMTWSERQAAHPSGAFLLLA